MWTLSKATDCWAPAKASTKRKRSEMCEIVPEKIMTRKTGEGPIMQESVVECWRVEKKTSEPPHLDISSLARRPNDLKKRNSRGAWIEETVLSEQSTWSDVSWKQPKPRTRTEVSRQRICARKKVKKIKPNREVRQKKDRNFLKMPIWEISLLAWMRRGHLHNQVVKTIFSSKKVNPSSSECQFLQRKENNS